MVHTYARYVTSGHNGSNKKNKRTEKIKSRKIKLHIPMATEVKCITHTSRKVESSWCVCQNIY